MSCTLLEFCRLQELETVRDYLFQSRKIEPQEETQKTDPELSWDVSDWESEWDSGDNKPEDATSASMVEETPGQSGPWLQHCVLTLSPCLDLLVVARGQKAAFLSAKWCSAEGSREEMTMAVSWTGLLSVDDGEHVSSCMCIPLVSQKRSSTGQPDWTCVVVGFTTGYVRFYTELLQEDPVLRLKCRTYEIPLHPGITEQHEELSILYPTALVTIDGFSLFQSLRACRNQVARAAAAGSDVIQPPPLAYKKWGLQDMDTIVDHSSVGIMTLCVFDQMKNASILGGFNASVKGSPPAMSLYVSVGGGPYIGFYYAVEGSSQPLLSHVALAVASKLTSALFNAASGWLGWNKNRNEEETVQKQKPKVEPATPLGIRFGLPDSRRHGESICLSPCNMLAGVTDDFGRVALLDLARGICIRMWKGYRDAQLGWLQVQEERGDHDSSSLPKRHALFLVIYAPRRGILEVWAMKQGPRVGAFNIGKHCRLLYAGHRLMGVNCVTSQGWHLHTPKVCLLDPAARTLRTVNIPFHLALSWVRTLLLRNTYDGYTFFSGLLTTASGQMFTMFECSLAQQEPSDVLLDELSRVRSTLQSYAQLSSRPSVSFAEDSPDSPLPVQAFLSQMEFTEDGSLRVIYMSETDHSQLGNFLFWGALCGKSQIAKVCDPLQQAGISPQQLLAVLLSVWFQREKEILQNPEQTTVNLHTLLITLSNMKGAVEDCWDPQSVSPWWQQVRSACIQSQHTAAALLAAFVAHHAAKTCIQHRADSKLQSDWEAVSLELEQWLVCVRQLEDLMVLQTLLLVPAAQGPLGGSATQCSIKTLLEGGRGAVADSISKWVFRHRLAPENLKAFLQKSDDPDDERHNEPRDQPEKQRNDQEGTQRTAELFVAVCERFPHSLSPDMLFAHCCWEHVVHWNRDPEEVKFFCLAVEHLKLVSSPHIQLGIATMMWSTFIVKYLSAATFLMEKVGKAPKDRLCRRDVGMGDQALTCFLGCCVQLLQVLMEADAGVEEETAPELSVEEVWCGAEGPPSIADLALEQKGIYYPLVQHHWLLASLLHAAMTFKVKVKPLSLFDSKGKNALFRDLSSVQLMPSGVMDSSLILTRQEVQMGWVQAVEGGSGSAPGSSTTHSDGLAAQWWPSLCLELGSLLQVNPDILRRQLVCELFSQGLDLSAEQAMLEVEDQDVLGSQLLVLSGQRLSYTLLHSQSQTQPAMELLARLPPTLCAWLKAMDPSDLRRPSLPLQQTKRLVGRLVEILPENHAQYSLALHLLEALEALTTED
ncbi:Rab3 GTPase-activating protein non-catalytic subunit [Takifugu flavidus]|uniref:Rab3 GTPase-activating protein non-catalytic subunit n=1 Tax=Takifugu flavidus TaxID=433684 RepID=A0A5C6NXM4_9TELE|nr:Rab3 GTPase-activating protein non-catalytic subunit [Takifugu flavidus]